MAYPVPLCQNGRLHPQWALPKQGGIHQDYQLYNSDRAPNVFCLNGTIVIEARPSSYVPGYAYSSGFLVQREPFGYGTLRVTSMLPKGKGLAPSIGLLPYDAMFTVHRSCAYPVAGACLWPTNGQIVLASTVNDRSFLPFIQHLSLGLPGTPSYPSAPEDRWTLPGMTPEWWDVPHVWELTRTATSIVMTVDGTVTFDADAKDLAHFLASFDGNDPRLDIYDTAIAPFDDSNPLQLVASVAMGGKISCSECHCCPVDRRFPLLNTTINDHPYSRLVIYSMEFEPLRPDSHGTFYLIAMALPLLVLILLQWHSWPTLLRMLRMGTLAEELEAVHLTRAYTYGSTLLKPP